MSNWTKCPNCGVLYKGKHICTKIREVWRKFQHGVQTGIYSGFDIDAWLNFAEDAGISRVEARKYWEQLGPTASSSVTVEEMRRALEGMTSQLEPPHSTEAKKIFEAAMFAAKTTMKDASERRVFVQDFFAALNRAGLLLTTEPFLTYGYVYMEAASEHSSNSEGEVRESYRTPEEAEKARQRGRIGYEFVRIEPLPPVKWVVVWRRSEASEHSSSHSSAKKKFAVRYLDNMGREHTEEIEDDIAFYQRVRREGLSVISIHKK